LGHNWNATDDLLSFTLAVDIANKKDKAKGLNKIITKDNLEYQIDQEVGVEHRGWVV
jgi:hypothetical protein